MTPIIDELFVLLSVVVVSESVILFVNLQHTKLQPIYTIFAEAFPGQFCCYNFLRLRLYFIVYPDLSHNIDTLNYKSRIDLPGRWKSWFFVFLWQLGNTGKYCPAQISNSGELNFNIIMFINWKLTFLY